MSVPGLQSINRLRNFGSYRSFSNTGDTSIPNFKKRNLIYGWNYSGKTTLSRLFQALEFPDRGNPYAGSSFSVTLSDGTHINDASENLAPRVRVFNRDYVSINFQQEHTAPAVFIVGEDNVILRNQLERAQLRLDAITATISRRNEQIRALETSLDQLITEAAGGLRGMIGVTDFRRPDLKRVITSVRNGDAEHFLSDEEKQSKIDTFRSADQFGRINNLTIELPNITETISAVSELLQRTASHDAIDGLSENSELQEWMRVGMSFHAETNQCQFCGKELPEERIEALRRHFSTAFMQLVRDIDRMIGSLQNLEITQARLDPVRFIQGLRDEATEKVENLNSAIQSFGEVRQRLIDRLIEKRTSLESRLGLELQIEDLNLQDALDSLNQVITRHNDEIGDLDRLKRDARGALERHLAADFISRQNLAERETQVEQLEWKKQRSTQAASRLSDFKERVAGQIDRTAIGAERFMELVSFLLRDSDIHVESHEETEFRLLRGDMPADRMSEGEKTAIAFAYFVTMLDADEEDITQTIVYVDDPISSLDSNHVYAVFALIEERLSEAMQLFVSTHNSEFFNLLKAKWLRDNRYRSSSEGFYVRKVEVDGNSSSILETLPLLLKKHGSEYEFIFAQLRQFANNPTPSEYEAFCAPNLLRRFLEAYLGFRKPCTPAWHAKLDLIIDSDVKRREIHKLLDDASHLQRADRALQIPTFITSAHDAAQAVLEGLEAKDAEHFGSLVEAVSRENAN